MKHVAMENSTFVMTFFSPLIESFGMGDEYYPNYLYLVSPILISSLNTNFKPSV